MAIQLGLESWMYFGKVETGRACCEGTTVRVLLRDSIGKVFPSTCGYRYRFMSIIGIDRHVGKHIFISFFSLHISFLKINLSFPLSTPQCMGRFILPLAVYLCRGQQVQICSGTVRLKTREKLMLQLKTEGSLLAELSLLQERSASLCKAFN